MKRALSGLLLIVCIVLTSCDNDVPYTELETGFGYKHIENAEGKKAAQGDIMVVNLKSVYDDSVMVEMSGKNQLRVNPFANPMVGFAQVLKQFDEGDSCHVRMKLPKYAELTGLFLTPDMDTSKYVTMQMRITEVENESILLERIIKEQQEIDAKIIQDYIAEKGLDAKEIIDGIYQVVIEEGTGPKPQSGQTVSVNYIVKYTDGRMIDTSNEELAKETGVYTQGRAYGPIEFQIGTQGIIQGWNKAIPFVNKGGKSILIIPSGDAYGIRGRGGIPPNTVLVFDIEVVDIK